MTAISTAPVYGADQFRPSAMDIAGTSVKGASNAESALREAGLFGWNVQKVPMFADLRDYPGPEQSYKDPKTFKTFGTINGRVTPLGTVGDQYQVVQNEEHAEFLDEVLGQSGGVYRQVASFKGGRLVYIAIELPDTVKVGGADPVNMCLYGINSHDMSTNFMLTLSPERMACANQLSYFRANSLKFRHSGNIKDKVMDAQRALGITFDLMSQFEEHANRLAGVSLSAGEYHDVVQDLHPEPEGYGEPGHKSLTTRYDKLMDGLEEALMSDANRSIAGTVWGGLNAYIEHIEWVAGSDKNRAERIMTSVDLEKKIVRARNAFSKFALAA